MRRRRTIWSKRIALKKASDEQISRRSVRSGPESVETCTWCIKSTSVGSNISNELPKASENWACTESRSWKPLVKRSA
jgi:hypothetical protein